MDHFGARYAALDVYNILSTGVEVDSLMSLLASLPGEQLSEALYDGSASVGLGLAAKVIAKSFGHWGQIYQVYRTKQAADRLLDHYEHYPSRPDGMEGWQHRRDDVMEDVYAVTGADPKY